MNISKLIETQNPRDGLNIPGINGYAGEQDGSHAVLSRVYRFDSRKDADEEFPGGVAGELRRHRARDPPRPGGGARGHASVN